MENKYSELEKLNQLKANGTITDAEFEVEKHKILNSTNNKSKKTVGIIAKCFFVVGCIVLIIAIIYGFKMGTYNDWLPTASTLMYEDEVKYYSLKRQGENATNIAVITLAITDISFAIASICQFISNSKNKKKVIILVAEIFTIIIITFIDILFIMKVT